MNAMKALVVMMVMFCGLSCARVRDYYRIYDLESGWAADVPMRRCESAWESVLACDDAAGVFYSLRGNLIWIKDGNIGCPLQYRITFVLRMISYDGEVVSEKELPEFPCLAMDGRVRAISPDRRRMVCWDNRALWLYDLNLAEKKVLLPNVNMVWGLWWPSEDAIIYCGGLGDNTVVSISLKSGEASVIYEAPAFGDNISRGDLSPDGRHLFICGGIDPLQCGVLDLATKMYRQLESDLDWEVEAECWSRDSNSVAYATPSSGVSVYSVITQKATCVRPVDLELWIYGMSFGSKGELYIERGEVPGERCGPTGIQKWRLLTWDPATGRIRELPQTFEGRLLSVVGGEKVLSVLDDDRDW